MVIFVLFKTTHYTKDLEWLTRTGGITRRLSDCEELVGVTHKKDTFTKDTILIKLNFEKQYFAVKLFI